jgi:hypothetical protein
MPAATPAAAQSSVFATLFQNVTFSGPYRTLYANTPDLKTVGFDDVASSLTVPVGVKVALYEHANYLGACTAFTAWDPDLSNNLVNLNDRVSSVRFGLDCPLQLYDSAGYHGPYRLFWSDVPNLAQYTFNDTVASLRVPPGTKVTAYSEPNYSGVCEEFSADDNDLFGNVSSSARISSVRLGAFCPPTQVVLFEHDNYEGEFRILAPPTNPQSAYAHYNLEELVSATGNFGERVSSVYLFGGPAVTLKDLDLWPAFGGPGCTHFTVSAPSLRGTKVSNDSAEVAYVSRGPDPDPGRTCEIITWPARLQAGQNLTTGQELVSSNGKARLVLQSDGNLVLRRVDTGAALWASNTVGKPMALVRMQADGNVAGYSTDGSVFYWDTKTAYNPGASLVLRDDGNLVVVAANGAQLWATNTRVP